MPWSLGKGLGQALSRGHRRVFPAGMAGKAHAPTHHASCSFSTYRTGLLGDKFQHKPSRPRLPHSLLGSQRRPALNFS